MKTQLVASGLSAALIFPGIVTVSPMAVKFEDTEPKSLKVARKFQWTDSSEKIDSSTSQPPLYRRNESLNVQPANNVQENSIVQNNSQSFSAEFLSWLNSLNILRTNPRNPVSSDSGEALQVLTLDNDLNNWAQKRAEQLAELGYITHNDMYNGAPSWALEAGGLFNSPSYQLGTLLHGPEALVSWTSGDFDPIDLWATEAETGASGYGHYLTEVSPYANRVGFGVSTTKTGKKIVVMEIGFL
ncbi:MAG: CAP domain-containing protein [Lactobacillaceae bacterium]|jgi:uncharacterized protein YkwD|nr:CAP domain-containing protein [Lactobacillaceae bacterium]